MDCMLAFLRNAFFVSVGRAFNDGETDIISRDIITSARLDDAAWYVGVMPDGSFRSGGYFVGVHDVIAFSVKVG